jgi:glycosyltransferase involved in cell wall biosynthesis
VAAGSGTTVSQNRLVEALRLAGLEAELRYPSHFGTTRGELEDRRRRNAQLQVAGCDAVLGIDGEGWLWAAKPRRLPYIAFCEAVLANVLPFEQGETRELLQAQAEWEGAAARAADAVVARSEYAAGCVAEAYGIPRERIELVPIPFDVAAWRASLPAHPREPLVLAAGHMYPRKNYAALLEAWPEVVRARPEAQLAVVGTGPEMARLQRLAGGLDGVHLPGHVPFSELLALHARASVFCHPSLQENFGIAVVEGLAAGASLVAHDLPAVRETVAGLPGVWLVDARDRPALARALLEALDAPSPWPEERMAGLRHKLDPARIGKQVAELVRRSPAQH